MPARCWRPLFLLSLLACGGAPASPRTPRPPSAGPTSNPQVTPVVRMVSDTDRTDPRVTRAMGSRAAPVTVYEMSDFQCPFCRRHALETMPVLERDYVATGKVRWVFINFPITEIHPNAVAAAEFALCAARDQKFWKVHQLIFRHQPAWAKLEDPGPFLLGLADSVGMNRGRTLACLQDPAVTRAVRAEAEGSARAGATSTPTFYIEGGLLVGAQPVDVFRPILDSIYKSKGGR